MNKCKRENEKAQKPENFKLWNRSFVSGRIFFLANNFMNHSIIVMLVILSCQIDY